MSPRTLTPSIEVNTEGAQDLKPGSHTRVEYRSGCAFPSFLLVDALGVWDGRMRRRRAVSHLISHDSRRTKTL